MEMCRWLFQGFTEIQNGRHRSTSKLFGQFFFKFQHHIPSNMGKCKLFLARLLILIKKGGLLQLKFGVVGVGVGVGVNIYLWAR